MHDHTHTWTYETGRFTGQPSRICTECKEREIYWEDDEDESAPYRYENNEPQKGQMSISWSIWKGHSYQGNAGSYEIAKKIVAALNEYNQPKDCGHCGIPVKREDMITGAYGGTFCCEQHRRAYDKE